MYNKQRRIRSGGGRGERGGRREGGGGREKGGGGRRAPINLILSLRPVLKEMRKLKRAMIRNGINEGVPSG